MSTDSSSSPLSAASRPEPADAGQPIRTAVMGYGLSGSVFHAPLIAANSRYSLDVIATSDAGRQTAALGRYPGVKTVADGEAVLALAADLDLVVLGTPPATHYPLGEGRAGGRARRRRRQALRGDAAPQGQELIELAARLGRVLTVFQNRRWDGDYLTVKALLASGSLGDGNAVRIPLRAVVPGGVQGLEGGGHGGRRRRRPVRPRHPPAGPGTAALRAGHGDARGAAGAAARGEGGRRRLPGPAARAPACRATSG